jgi:hypothetical protein
MPFKLSDIVWQGFAPKVFNHAMLMTGGTVVGVIIFVQV